MLLSPFSNQMSHHEHTSFVFFLALHLQSLWFIFYLNKLLFITVSKLVFIRFLLTPNSMKIDSFVGNKLLFSSTLKSILFSWCEKTHHFYIGRKNVKTHANACMSFWSYESKFLLNIIIINGLTFRWKINAKSINKICMK